LPTSGNYTVTVTRVVCSTATGICGESAVFSPNSVPVNVDASVTQNFTAQGLSTLSGYVMSLASTGAPSVGMPGVQLTLQTKNSTAGILTGLDSVFTATTDKNGYYSIGGLTAGNIYTLTPVLSGYQFASAQSTIDYSNFSIDGSAFTVDITGFPNSSLTGGDNSGVQ
jgi:hypothetical protein